MLKERSADQRKVIHRLKRQINEFQKCIGLLPSNIPSMLATPFSMRSRRSSMASIRAPSLAVLTKRSTTKTPASRAKSSTENINDYGSGHGRGRTGSAHAQNESGRRESGRGSVGSKSGRKSEKPYEEQEGARRPSIAKSPSRPSESETEKITNNNVNKISEK